MDEEQLNGLAAAIAKADGFSFDLFKDYYLYLASAANSYLNPPAEGVFGLLSGGRPGYIPTPGGYNGTRPGPYLPPPAHHKVAAILAI